MPTETRIALDTNMLMAIGQHKIDIFTELEKMLGKTEYTIPEQVLQELHSIEEQKPAKIAQQEIKKHNVKIEKNKAQNADQALEEMAKKGYAIATNDAALRKRIKGFGGKVIYLRQLRFLKQD